MNARATIISQFIYIPAYLLGIPRGEKLHLPKSQSVRLIIATTSIIVDFYSNVRRRRYVVTVPLTLYGSHLPGKTLENCISMKRVRRRRNLSCVFCTPPFPPCSFVCINEQKRREVRTEKKKKEKEKQWLPVRYYTRFSLKFSTRINIAAESCKIIEKKKDVSQKENPTSLLPPLSKVRGRHGCTKIFFFSVIKMDRRRRVVGFESSLTRIKRSIYGSLTEKFFEQFILPRLDRRSIAFALVRSIHVDVICRKNVGSIDIPRDIPYDSALSCLSGAPFQISPHEYRENGIVFRSTYLCGAYLYVLIVYSYRYT